MNKRAILDVTPANGIREMSFGDKKRRRTRTTNEPDTEEWKPPRTRSSVARQNVSPSKSTTRQTATPKKSTSRQTSGSASARERTSERGETGGGRTRTVPADQFQQLQQEKSSLRQQLEETKRLLGEQEKELRSCRDELARAASREREISATLVDTERALSRASNDLTTVRSFADDSAADVPTFLTLFDDINDDIGDFARCLVRKLPLQDDIIEDIDIEALERKNKAVYSYLAGLLISAEKWSCRLEQTLMVAIQALFAVTLQDTIFSPFAPGVGSDSGDVLKEVEQVVQSQEPQLYYARWRAMTYKTAIASRVENFLQPVVDKFVELVAQLLSIFCDEPDPALESMTSMVRQIFAMAVEWQDQARTAHFSFDYRPLFIGPKVAFCPETMERQPLPPGKRKSKGAASGGGRFLDNESGDLVPVGKILRKARVL